MIKAMKIVPSLFSAFSIGASAAGAGATTAATGVTLFGNAIKFSFPLVAALSTVLVGIIALAPKISDFFKDITNDVEYTGEKFKESTEALKENEQKLAELKETSWRDWTPEIEEEIRLLEAENEQLRRNKEYWEGRATGAVEGSDGYTVTKRGYRISKTDYRGRGAAETTVLGEGETAFTFTVVDGDGNETAYEIHTDKATVGEALLELGLIDGEDGDYGLYVKTVNGVTVDYDTDGKYWAFYVDGEYAQTGVDSTEVTPGANYAFKVE